MFRAKSLKNAQLYNENFEHFFTEKLNSLTPELRTELPYELVNKLYTKKGTVSAEKLSFNEKMYLLQGVFQCDVVLLVADAENGLSIADFTDSIKAQKGKMGNGELLGKLRIKSFFALGGKELMASVLYQAHICCTHIYSLVKEYVPNASHKKNEDYVAKKKAYTTTIDFLCNYEAKKRRITTDYGLTMPDWYALLFFAKGEAFGTDFYNHDFKFSYNSDKGNLIKAIQRMHTRGYLNKRKVTNKDRYTISAKGIDVMDRIFNNILLKI